MSVVAVIDGLSGARIETVTGEQGVLRGALRGLARERKRRDLGSAQPFVLISHADGRLTLVDPATGQRIDLESFGPAEAIPELRAELGASPGDILIGTVGRMVAFKGHKYLIDAADIIARGLTGAAIRFAVIGDGALLEDCRMQAAASAAADRP